MAALAPLAIVAGGTGIAGSLVAAKGHMLAAQEQSNAALFEKQQLEVQQQQIETASAQDEAKRRDALTSSLETIQALRAGRGVGSASPTGLAIANADVSNSETDINTARTNYAQKADSAGMSAIMAGRKAQTSLLAGKYAAAADILGGVSKASSIGMKA